MLNIENTLRKKWHKIINLAVQELKEILRNRRRDIKITPKQILDRLKTYK